ncbi:hypothetical protein [Streptomyces sp. NPDC020681]|uniref:hypothetical protein n=1 Tax=Streptomyces sp. NPDC020681 TaxID=3365083 RepID=UPI0037B7A907
MSTPPPNPYTQPQFPQQQPQFPSYPQAQPQAQPQPGYGAQPPYPYQQQPYPGQGGPGGWGAPPPPPRKNKGPMIALITVGAIAAVAAFSWFGNNVVGGGSGGSSESFPEATHELTRPQTLLGGRYKLDDDMSEDYQDELAGTSEANIRDAQGSMARYLSQAEGGVLIVSGMHGRIKDPDEARSRILKGAGDSDGSTIAVPAKDFTPAGSEVAITCQVLTTKQTDGAASTLPMCAWADGNTTAAIALTSVKTAKQSPQEVDLKAVVEETVKVREEMRRPIA